MINLVLSITISLFFAHTAARARIDHTAERCVVGPHMAEWDVESVPLQAVVLTLSGAPELRYFRAGGPLQCKFT